MILQHISTLQGMAAQKRRTLSVLAARPNLIRLDKALPAILEREIAALDYALVILRVKFEMDTHDGLSPSSQPANTNRGP